MADDTPNDSQVPEDRDIPKWKASYLATVTKFRRRREKLGMTQAEVAVKIGVSLRTYQRREGGFLFFDGPELFRVAEILGVEISTTTKP